MHFFRPTVSVRLLAAAAMLAAIGTANAQSTSQGHQGGHGGTPPEPPAAAYKACEGKKEGDSVKVTMPDGRSVEATCAKHGDKLAARPQQPAARR